MECVRKLKHERQPLDWIFRFSLWSSSTALSEARLTAKQVTHKSVKPADFESSIADKKLLGSNLRISELCSMTSPVSPLLPLQCENRILHTAITVSARLVSTGRKEAIPVTAILGTTSQPGNHRVAISLPCARMTPGRRIPCTLVFSTVHHIAFLTPADPALC